MKTAVQKDDVQKWLSGLFRDPVATTLMKNSHLTRIQLETFLIDILADRMSGKKLIYEKKARLRLLRSGVSRGSFNRTLAQARKNVIGAIYTIVLLGYLGVFETPCLDAYVEIAGKIRAYTEAYKDAWKDRGTRREHLRIISMLQREIEKALEDLSETRSMSERT